VVELASRRETWAFAIGKFFPDRLVVLDLLAAALLPEDLPPDGGKSTLCYGDVRRKLVTGHRRRVASPGHAQARQEPQRRAQTLHAGLRFVRAGSLRALPWELWVVMAGGAWLRSASGFSRFCSTMPSDCPQVRVGSVVGLAPWPGAGVSCCCSSAPATSRASAYTPLFVYAGSGYLVALVLTTFSSPQTRAGQVEGGRQHRQQRGRGRATARTSAPAAARARPGHRAPAHRRRGCPLPRAFSGTSGTDSCRWTFPRVTRPLLRLAPPGDSARRSCRGAEDLGAPPPAVALLVVLQDRPPRCGRWPGRCRSACAGIRPCLWPISRESPPAAPALLGPT